MKAIIQRVANAKVTVGDELVSSIGRGLLVLIGICNDDNALDVEYIVRKILNIRVFEDATGKRWSQSVIDQNLEILCVSQFTLYHKLKGNKPDFHLAMPPTEAEVLYSTILKMIGEQYQPEKVKDGRFSAYMQVSSQNDGPVTIEIESPEHSQHEMDKLARAVLHEKHEKEQE